MDGGLVEVVDVHEVGALKITIEIHTAGAAFQSEEGPLETEVGIVLAQAGRGLSRDAALVAGNSFRLLDSNGNTCGLVRVVPE